MCPPLVIGPIVHYLNSLDALNTSNQRTRDCMTGKWKQAIPDTGTFIWVDVRDLALCHVLAIEKEEAANKRFFITEGYFSNKEIAEVIRKNFPELESELPGKDVEGGDYPGKGKESLFKVDNSRTKEILGVSYIGFEKSIVDLVKSLKAVQ
jgi:nucleoside-diphosphate-sugar epimerase